VHILIVDDEDIVRQTLGDYLQELGYQVDYAVDGSAGLKAVEANTYSLALVDIRLPGMDGLSLLRHIRSIHPEMPVIILTGHGDPSMSEEALALGATDFLYKPIKLLDLDALLDRLGPGLSPDSR
jgi:DNA-binding NtrC family response regulator